MTTFMGVPAFGEAQGGANAIGAGILGIPYEATGHRPRTGADQGPAGIRAQSELLRPYQPPHADFNPLERLGVADFGDVEIPDAPVGEVCDAITAGVGRVLEAGAVPVCMGGDGSVTLGQLRALGAHHPPLGLIHIDAHADAGPGKAPDELSPTTTFTRAAEEGLLDMNRAVNVGLRGTQRAAGAFDFAASLGYENITADEMIGRGLAETGAYLKARMGEAPVFLCFDMDFFDPACAPGVCQPEVGGPQAREGLALLQSLAGLDFAGFDINTVSPPHDVGGITQLLAGRVMLECLALAAAEDSRLTSS